MVGNYTVLFMQVLNYPFTSTFSLCIDAGKVIKDYCLTCRGSGVVDGMKHVEVKLPAGIDSGDTIHVPEAADSDGFGTEHGSLYNLH
ncbi:unnamed protein product [Urochloa humidicola]